MKPPFGKDKSTVGVAIYWQNEPGTATAVLVQGNQSKSFAIDSLRNDHMVIPVTPGIPATITLNGDLWWSGMLGQLQTAVLSDANKGLRDLAIQNCKNAIGAMEAIK